MKARRTLFLLLTGCLGLLIVLSVVLYFSAARIINSETVKQRIYTALLEKTGVRIEYGRSEVILIPLPQIVFHQVNISIPDKGEGSVASLRAYPGLWSLLKGDVLLSELDLEAPHFTVRISADTEKPSLEQIEEKIRSAAQYLTSREPGLRIVLRDGRINLTEADDTPFSFQEIQSRLTISRQSLEIDVAAKSNVFDDLSLSASLTADDLRSEGTVRLSRLRPDMILARLSRKAADGVTMSDLNLTLKFAASGLRAVKASMESSVSGLVISRGMRQMALGDAELQGDVSVGPEAVSVLMREAKVSRPALNLSGHYTHDRGSGLITLDVEGKAIAVQPLRTSVLAFADDIPLVRTIFLYVQGGTIPALHLHSEGTSLSELGLTERIRISGSMTGGTIYVQAKDLTFQDVAGDVSIAQGILDAQNVGASLGNHRCSGGTLRTGLKGKDALFHIDMRVAADVAQLPSLLREKHLVRNGAFLRELDRIQDLRGSAGGRLILGERLDAIHVKITVDDMQITARYQPVPFPIAVTGGRFFFDEETLGVTDAAGSLGRSSFSGLTARLGLTDPSTLDVVAGQFSVSADEIYPWITSFEKIRPVLKDVRSVLGSLALSSVSFRGPLSETGKWQFRAAGEARSLSLDAAFIPGKAEDMNGTFEITQNELSLKDIRTKLADSLLTVSGVIREFPSDIKAIDLSLQGEIGQKVTEWVSALAHLPPEMTIRAPFSVTDGILSIEKDRKTAFSGRLLFGRGTTVSLSVTKTLDTTAIHDLTIQDLSSHGAVGITITKAAIDAAFQGKLTPQTLSTILRENTFSGASLEGDFRTHVVLAEPQQSSAEGRVKGENIPIPWDRDIPLTLRHISVETADRDIVISSADLALQDMTIEARGKVSRMPKWFSVDMDLSSNGIAWETLGNILREGKPAADRKKTGFLKDLPVRGSLRLRSDFFQYKRFRWEPFHADISFDGKTALLTTKKAALCGVSTTGTAALTEQGLKLDVVLSAKDLAFRPTILCLTDKNFDYTGTFQMEARLRGEGTIGEIAHWLDGTFTLTAKDGRILKSRSLDKTFDLLNKSENFKAQFPDLGREIITYETFRALGRIREQKIQIDEVMIDSSVIEIMARGSIDLINETIDLTALLAPLKAVHRVARRIPILGHISGGSLTSIPVRISGNMKDPQVRFLSPSAIGSEILGIVERTLKLPITLVEPIFPAQKDK